MTRYGFDPETGRLNMNPEFFRAGAPDPYGRPLLSAAPARKDDYWRNKPTIGSPGLRFGQGGSGDDLHMLGERMNPLTEAGMFFAGVPTAVGGSSGLLASAATAYGFMEGMNYLSENHPDAARYANVGMAAAAVPGVIRAGRGKAGAFINEAVAEPTPQKVNLLKAMYDDWLARNPRDVTKEVPAGPEGPTFHHSPTFHHPDVPHPIRTIPYADDVAVPTPTTAPKKASAATPGQSGMRTATLVFKKSPVPSAEEIVRRPVQRIGEAWTSLSEEKQDRALVEYLNGLTDDIKGVPGSLLRKLRADIPRQSMSAFAADEVANGVAFPFADYFKRLIGRNEARANAGDLAYLARLEDVPGYRLYSNLHSDRNIFNDEFIKGTEAYARWVDEFGSAEADSFLRTLRDPVFRRYFYGDDPVFAASEMETYAKARNTINAVTEPYEIVLGGSAGISQEGRIGRGSAVPHDLDFSGYIANASREPLRPGGLTEEARARVAAALTDRANIENAPVILKLRELYPELRDATFRYATRDWEFGGGSQYEPGTFTVPKVSPSFTKEGHGSMLVTTVVDGQNVDIMLSDGEIRTALGEPRFGSADTAFAWKRAYGDARWSGLRPKDAADIAFYEQYGPGNKIIEPASGRAGYAPFKFADRLIDSDGIPVVAAVEETPGGKKVPMFMNYKGEMLRADDPYWLQLYHSKHPVNNPAYRDGPVATGKSHPLVNVRVTRDQLANGAPGEAGPSIGVYRANDPETLAVELLSMGDPVFGSRSGTVRVYPREVSDPRLDLSTRLLGGNGYTGYIWEPESTKRLVHDWEHNPLWSDYLDAVDDAKATQTPQSLDRLGRVYGELTRPFLNKELRMTGGERKWGGYNPEFTRIDSAFRKYVYDANRGHAMSYPAEAKPMRYVPHYVEVDPRSPNAHKELTEALRKMSYAVPLAVGLGLGAPESDEETQQAAKGGKAPDRFAMSRNFLATDKTPDTLFGIPVVADRSRYTPEDLAFFRKHPEAGGYYDMGNEGGAPPERPVKERQPMQVERQAASLGGDTDGTDSYKDMTIRQKLDRADELLKQYEGTDKYDAFKQRVDAMHAKYDPVTEGLFGNRVKWDYAANRPDTSEALRQASTNAAQGTAQAVTSGTSTIKAAVDVMKSMDRRWNAALTQAKTVSAMGQLQAMGQKPITAAQTIKTAYKNADGILAAANARNAVAGGLQNVAKVTAKNLVTKANVATGVAVGAVGSAVRQGADLVDTMKGTGSTWSDVGKATGDVFTTKQGWKNLGWGLLGSLKDVANSVTFGAVDNGDKLRENMMDAKGGEAKKRIPPIVRGPIHHGPPPPPSRGKYPGVANNPGNVEKHERRSDKTLFKGEIAGGVRPKRFANFSDPVDGLVAAATVLSRRAAGLAAKGLPFTIENYVPGYAPKSENDVEGYINNLSKYSGFARDAALDTGNAEDMAKLLKNVVRFESGVPNSEWFTDDEYRRAALAMQEGASGR